LGFGLAPTPPNPQPPTPNPQSPIINLFIQLKNKKQLNNLI